MSKLYRGAPTYCGKATEHELAKHPLRPVRARRLTRVLHGQTQVNSIVLDLEEDTNTGMSLTAAVNTTLNTINQDIATLSTRCKTVKHIKGLSIRQRNNG